MIEVYKGSIKLQRLTRALCVFALAAHCLAYAQGSEYPDKVKSILKASESLEEFLRANIIDFNAYDNWHKEFKQSSDTFRKDFFATHKQKESFQLMQKALNTLSSAWGALRQADYSENQYQEYITSGDVEYAHKWKSTVNEQKKAAREMLVQALDYFEECRRALDRED